MQSSIFLSILIPLYNWDIRPLLDSLHEQAKRLQDKYALEIVVLDDGSTEEWGIEALLPALSLVSYEKFDANRGRAAIRNLLLQRARGEFVLFLDADMLPDQDSFLQRYVEQAERGRDIVCGGLSYRQNTCAGTEFSFYFHKSAKTEALPATRRNGAPWRYLFTSNVMLRRYIAQQVPFDPRFTGYGYEDIEWALRLSKQYAILHIDNTCTHMGAMTKEQTCARMRESIDNYALLLALHPRETARSGAARTANLLKGLPAPFLRLVDDLLVRLFTIIRWDPLTFLVFQCDKMVLLASSMKRRTENPPSHTAKK